VSIPFQPFRPLQRTRLPAASLALLTRQLASLVQSGMPLDQALLAVHEQADDVPARKVVDAIRTQVMAGESLPAALSRFPRTFSPLYRGLIGAGTETGRLPEVLTRLADYLDARLALRQKFVVALIYPARQVPARVRLPAYLSQQGSEELSLYFTGRYSPALPGGRSRSRRFPTRASTA
jgi:general secretion pathway protein F